MVFYDIRDIGFEDAGISERMRDTIEAARRDDGEGRPLQLLSDMLAWLARKGFHVRICVDRRHAQEQGVGAFLAALNPENDAGRDIRVLEKDLGPVGSLHAKGLLTPIGVVDGSANLTRSALASNEELINFSAYGTPGYDELRVGMADILQGTRSRRDTGN